MRTTWAAAVLPLLVVVVVSGCGADQQDPSTDVAPSGPAPTPTARISPTPVLTEPSPAASESDEPEASGELTAGPVRHVVNASGLRVSVEYVPDTPVESWTAEGAKPVQVSVTVQNSRQPRQKVFLTRATLRFTATDGIDEIPGPEPLVDTANITPGYLTTDPYSYVQSFAIPSLDVSTRQLTIDLKLELVSLVDAKARDYTKQTVTDTVRASVAF